MNYSTLVLDVSCAPIYCVDWRKAITLIFLGKATVVSEHDAVIRSPSTEMKVPSIIKFGKYLRNRHVNVKFSKRGLYWRDNGTCQYCGTTLSRNEATCDHVIPRVRGGSSSWTNIVLSCRVCNGKKGDHLLEHTDMQLLRLPRTPRVSPLIEYVKRTGRAHPDWDAYLDSKQ